MDYTSTKADIKYDYHKHIDAEGTERAENYMAPASGGCYTKAVYGKSTPIKVTCHHIMYYSELMGDGSGKYKCFFHPNGYYNYNGKRYDDADTIRGLSSIGYSADPGDYTHKLIIGYNKGSLKGYSCNCGKTESTLESATIIFK